MNGAGAGDGRSRAGARRHDRHRYREPDDVSSSSATETAAEFGAHQSEAVLILRERVHAEPGEQHPAVTPDRVDRQGTANREVAATFFVSEKTIEYHLSHAYEKLGLRGRVELAGHTAGT